MTCRLRHRGLAGAPAFNLRIPAIDDDGIVLSESAAMVIYLAKKSGDPVGGAQQHSNGEALVDFS